MVMDSSKNVRWIILFKKFGMVRVKKVKMDLDLMYSKFSSFTVTVS